jgi:hypothetical protein
METLRIDIQNHQEKKVLMAFLDSLGYHYRTENDDYMLTDAEIKEMVKRKADFPKGKTSMTYFYLFVTSIFHTSRNPQRR